jgi:hypothetical protein
MQDNRIKSIGENYVYRDRKMLFNWNRI